MKAGKFCTKTQKSLRRTAPLNICRLRNLYRHCFPAVAYTFRGYRLCKSPRSEKSQRCIGSQTAGNCLLVMMTMRDSVRRSRPLPFRSMSLPDRHCTIHLLVQIYTFRGYRLCKSPHSHSKIQRCIGSQKTTRCLLMMLRMRDSSCKLRKSWHLPPLSTSLLDSQCTRYFLNRWRTFLLDNGCNLFWKNRWPQGKTCQLGTLHTLDPTQLCIIARDRIRVDTESNQGRVISAQPQTTKDACTSTSLAKNLSDALCIPLGCTRCLSRSRTGIERSWWGISSSSTRKAFSQKDTGWHQIWALRC